MIINTGQENHILIKNLNFCFLEFKLIFNLEHYIEILEKIKKRFKLLIDIPITKYHFPGQYLWLDLLIFINKISSSEMKIQYDWKIRDLFLCLKMCLEDYPNFPGKFREFSGHTWNNFQKRFRYTCNISQYQEIPSF